MDKASAAIAGSIGIEMLWDGISESIHQQIADPDLDAFKRLARSTVVWVTEKYPEPVMRLHGN